MEMIETVLVDVVSVGERGSGLDHRLSDAGNLHSVSWNGGGVIG